MINVGGSLFGAPEGGFSPEQEARIKQIIKEVMQFTEVEGVLYMIHHVEPSKPRPGIVYYADGTNWDPKDGEGLYRWTLGGTWEFVG